MSVMNANIADEEISIRINEEYDFYINKVKPFIDLVEVYYSAIPDSLLNEIRNYVGHISWASFFQNEPKELRLENIQAAHTHLRRVLLDCFKLMCINRQDYINEFRRKFRFFNISDVDDGDFLINLKDYSDKADRAFTEAKNADSTGKNEKDKGELGEVYEKYANAYNLYCQATEYIDSHYSGVLRIARKHVFWKFLSGLGWVISIILAIISIRLSMK